MRIKVGRIVDVDSNINLIDLSPVDRVIASAINAYRGTSFYRRRYAETEERKEEERRKRRESLVDSLLARIVPELEENTSLKDKSDVCSGLLLEVPSRFKDYIAEAIESHEFDAYEITVIPPTKILTKFANPPYLLHVKSKEG